MATAAQPTQDFSALPEVADDVFTAPLQRPAQVGEDWLEPKQRDYSSDDDAIWNDLFERQMDILPGRACGAFLAGLQKLHLNRGGVPEFAKLSEELGHTENRIAFARQAFNDSVLDYNNAAQQVPTNLVAGIFSFKQAAMLEATANESERAAVRVNL